jgi:hypothetical protein
MKAIIERPTFFSNPDCVVGIPVLLANRCFAADIPNALFHEKEKPYLAILLVYVTLIYQLQLDVFIVDSNLFSISSARPLKKSIPVSDSILSILVAKAFKLELLP